MITISIVSHSHSNLISDLLKDLKNFDEISKIIITKNIKENDILVPRALDKKIKFIENDRPKGFGSNHNYAANYCETPFFCILNPDINFDENFFLYYEDVDLCKRAKNLNLNIKVCPKVYVKHFAQRDSHKKFKFFIFHVKSILRYFIKIISLKYSVK